MEQKEQIQKISKQALEHMKVVDAAKNKKLPDDLKQNWEVDTRFGESGYVVTDNGAKVVALRHKKENKVTVAYAPFKEFDDVDDLHDGGKKQWQAVKKDVEGYLSGLSSDTEIEQVGHSMGGGIAQHAMHDLLAEDSPYKDRTVKGYGYDAIGAAEHMEEPSRLNGGKMRHILVKNNDLNTVSGSHAGDDYYSLEPSKDWPLVGEVASHVDSGVKASLNGVLEGRKTLEKTEHPQHKADSLSGAIANGITKIGQLYDWQKDVLEPVRVPLKDVLLPQPSDEDIKRRVDEKLGRGKFKGGAFN